MDPALVRRVWSNRQLRARLSLDDGGNPGSGATWGEAGTAKFVGSGSPVGVITPSAKSDLYLDEAAPAIWQATGTLNTDWQLIDAAETARAEAAEAGLAPVVIVAGETGDFACSPGHFYYVDATGGPVAGTLPAPANGAVVTVKKTDASVNAVTVLPHAAESIDGASSFPLSVEHQAATFVGDGSNWQVGPPGASSGASGGSVIPVIGGTYHANVGDIVVCTGINDGITASGSPTLQAASAEFTDALVGLPVGDSGYNGFNSIPPGTTVLSVESPTSLTMSADATGDGTGDQVYFSLQVDPPPTPALGDSYTVISAVPGTSSLNQLNTHEAFTYRYDGTAWGLAPPAVWSGGPNGEATLGSGLNNAATGQGSVAEGVQTTASGAPSHAEGQQTIASGGISHAEGQQTTAAGSFSHAEGYLTATAKNAQGSHTEGAQTIAGAASGHAEGFGSRATGAESHAQNDCTIASGEDSHAQGHFTQAWGPGSSSEGAFAYAGGSNHHAHAAGQFAFGGEDAPPISVGGVGDAQHVHLPLAPKIGAVTAAPDYWPARRTLRLKGSVVAREATGADEAIWDVSAVISTNTATLATVTADVAPTLPLTVVAGVNDEFLYFPNPYSFSYGQTFTVAPGTYTTLAELVTAMGAAVGSLLNPRTFTGDPFSTLVTVDSVGGKIRLTAAIPSTVHNGDEIQPGDFGSITSTNDVAVALGFTGGPDTFAGESVTPADLAAATVTRVYDSAGAAGWTLAFVNGTLTFGLGGDGRTVHWLGVLEWVEVG